MSKAAPLLFLLFGVVIVWLGITGRLGVFLASIFTPGSVTVNG